MLIYWMFLSVKRTLSFFSIGFCFSFEVPDKILISALLVSNFSTVFSFEVPDKIFISALLVSKFFQQFSASSLLLIIFLKIIQIADIHVHTSQVHRLKILRL